MKQSFLYLLIFFLTTKLLAQNTMTYTSEERFSEEKNKFFEEYPQIIGMSGDLPESGSFLTIEDFGAPILATRDETGAFKAFANVCAHRAVIVENDKKGLKSKFSSPFHGWTYDNKGKLIGFPNRTILAISTKVVMV